MFVVNKFRDEQNQRQKLKIILVIHFKKNILHLYNILS